jgi:hypothetical protein
MRKLIPINKVIEAAEVDGDDLGSLFVDPDDVCAVNPDDLDVLEENPDEDED